MSEQSTQDRQLPASERKLKKAREDGQVVRSKDLGHFLVMLAAALVLINLGPWWTERLRELLHAGLRFDARAVANPGVMLDRAATFANLGLMLVVPMGAGIALASVASSVLSGGWNMSFGVVLPNFGKLDPFSGLGRVFSKQQLVDALKGSLMGLVLGAVGAWLLWRHWPGMVQLLQQPLPTALEEMAGTLRSVLTAMLVVLALFALIDWPLQRFMFMEKMKMSRQDMKDEMRQAEGNGEVKGRMKQRMREIGRRRMLAAVPQADLVVMNPTHYAVALKYDEGSMGAPRVVAKGLDVLAMKIRDVAAEHKVPVLEAPPLARALYTHCKLDHEVPMGLYSAVAQVLAYVYQLKAAMAGHSPMPASMPDLPVPAELDPHSPEAIAQARAAGRFTAEDEE